MDPLLYASVSVLVVLIVGLIFFLKFNKSGLFAHKL